MITLLRREFTMELPPEKAWQHLARVEQWPSWAKHIKQVEWSEAEPAAAPDRGGIMAFGGSTALQPPRRVSLVVKRQEGALMAADVKRVRHGQVSAACAPKSSEPSVQVKGIEDRIRAGADVGETDKNGVTLLHHAVRFRSPAAVRALIAKGANVNQTCKRSGSTPLHRAVTSTGAPGTAGMQAEAREIVARVIEGGLAGPGTTGCGRPSTSRNGSLTYR